MNSKTSEEKKSQLYFPWDERKKKGNISILREIFGILGQPVAEGHDCKKHEDAANADDENDHHDHRVAVALFHYSHNIKDKRAVACRGLDAGQSEEKKSLKNVARSGDIVWSRGRSGPGHK